MPKVIVLGICALNFCGWGLILASAAFNQSKVGSAALNFPLDWHGADQSTLTTWAATGSKTMRAAAQNWPVPNLGLGYSARDKIPEIIAGAALSPGGRALSYLWWIVSFQLVGIILAATAVSKRMLRIGVVGVFGVLTSSTFQFTNDVYAAPKTGIFALTHDRSLSIDTPDSNSPIVDYYRGLVVLFVGLLVVDVCNVFTMLLLPAIDSKPEQPVVEKAVTDV